jgi:hypothetical protein
MANNEFDDSSLQLGTLLLWYDSVLSAFLLLLLY